MEAAAERMPISPDVTLTPLVVAGRAAERVAPATGTAQRTMLYLHGGGYTSGSLATHRALSSWLAALAGLAVVTVDYRLAPEHAHPAALDDAVAAYESLLAEDHDPARLVIGGDSAGGGLAVAALVSLRDRGVTLPAAGVCLSPWTDLALPAGSLDRHADTDPRVARWLLSGMAEHYLGGLDPADPLTSPVHADLGGLPPLLIHVGGAEALLDDAVRLTAAAAAAGVSVTLHCEAGQMHVWHAYAPDLPEAVTALSAIGSWLDASA